MLRKMEKRERADSAALDELVARVRVSTVALEGAISSVHADVQPWAGPAHNGRHQMIAVLGDALDGLVAVLHALEQRPASPVGVTGLTGRQAEIIGMIAAGYTEKELARRLGMSRATAHTHVNRLFKRFDVHSRAALIARSLPPSPGRVEGPAA